MVGFGFLDSSFCSELAARLIVFDRSRIDHFPLNGFLYFLTLLLPNSSTYLPPGLVFYSENTGVFT